MAVIFKPDSITGNVSWRELMFRQLIFLKPEVVILKLLLLKINLIKMNNTIPSKNFLCFLVDQKFQNLYLQSV